jgi:hypothetical protein
LRDSAEHWRDVRRFGSIQVRRRKDGLTQRELRLLVDHRADLVTQRTRIDTRMQRIRRASR